ncbi:hypothetical protein BDD12DRAFT_802947 [Trichophaea hybrida]|nr:hypothetical protein BDD12DRAFT_802947 [Trichophaea hybrida]
MEPQAKDRQPKKMNPILHTEPDAKLSKIVNQYQRGALYGSLVHCTMKLRNWWSLHLIKLIRSLRRQTSQTQESRAKEKHFEQAVYTRSFTILTTMMLRWTMVCWIPFDNLQPIIIIPQIVMECHLVTYTEASGGRNVHWKLVNCNYQLLKDSITSETADVDRQPLVVNDEKKLIKTLQPRWQFIRIVAHALDLEPPTMFQDTSRAQMLWKSNKSDDRRPNGTKVAEIIKMFATDFPGQTDRIPSGNHVNNTNNDRFEGALRCIGLLHSGLSSRL